MKLTKNMKNYNPLIIPLDKPVEELTKKEAKWYFDWFLANINERSEYLKKKISNDLEYPIEKIDNSFESLRIVWKWFLNIAEVSRTTWRVFDETKKESLGHLQNIEEHIMKGSGKDLTVFTRYVLRDIGMYVGKVFIENSPFIEWTYRTTPKTYISVNEPILVGFIDDNPNYPKPFYPDLNPIALVEVCALNILDKTQQADDLYNTCVKWKNWLP